jgi:peptide/nickel transport system substrate-binding protein
VAIANGAASDTLDPGTYNNSYQILIASSVCNYLLEIGSDGKVAQELAESIEPNADATAFVVHLRKGIVFHNGKSFGPADVIASFNHHRGENSSSAIRSLLTQVTDIKADGPNSVIFTLTAPNVDFPYIMSDYHLPIFPAEDDRIDVTTIIGTGGYVLDSFEPGVRALLQRNPNYWKDGHSNFDSGEILVVTDVVARTNALTTGEVDVMERCDLNTLHLLERRPGIKIQESSSIPAYHSMPMFTDVAPFTDKNVRLALKYAIDREAMVKSVFRGYATPGNDNPITPYYRYHNDQIDQRAYDPDKAKFHLKQAGMSELSVEFFVAEAAFLGAIDNAVLFKEHAAAAAGINIDIRREPNDGYWNRIWRNKPFMMGSMAGRATEDWILSSNFAADSPWNDAHWQHERFNMLLAEARGEFDENKRRDMYFEMQQIIHDDGGTIVHILPSRIDAVNEKVQHNALAGNWALDGGRCFDRWWYA